MPLNQSGPCKLCGKTAKLLKKSHIIPKFFEKLLRDENNRIVYHHFNSQQPPKIVQHGFYEKYILCYDCDNRRLANLERYIAGFINGGLNPLKFPIKMERFVTTVGLRFIRVQELNYSIIKLALLSILWRSHISKNPFYQYVSIQEHEVDLRKMIMNEDPKDENTYRISIYSLLLDEVTPLRVIGQPTCAIVNEFQYAVFLISGFAFNIELKYSPENVVFKNSLKTDGSIDVPVMSPYHSMRYLKAYFKVDESISEVDRDDLS